MRISGTRNGTLEHLPRRHKLRSAMSCAAFQGQVCGPLPRTCVPGQAIVLMPAPSQHTCVGNRGDGGCPKTRDEPMRRLPPRCDDRGATPTSTQAARSPQKCARLFLRPLLALSRQRQHARKARKLWRHNCDVPPDPWTQNSACMALMSECLSLYMELLALSQVLLLPLLRPPSPPTALR